MNTEREIDLLLCAAELAPDTIAVRFDSHALTYRDLREAAARCAQRLKDIGVARGAVVALLMENSVEFVTGYFAIHWLGCIAMPLNPKDSSARLQDCLDRAGAKAVLVRVSADTARAPFTSLFRVRILALDEQATPELPLTDVAPPMDYAGNRADTAVIMFTTGTTGVPKGVKLRHENTLSALRGILDFMRPPIGTVEVLPTPLYHSFGLARMRVVFACRGTLVLVRGFMFPAKVVDLVEKYKATGFASVPAGWEILMTVGGERFSQAFQSVRYAEIGSAAMPIDRKRQIMKLLPEARICMHYGLTEASRSAFMEFHESSGDLETIGKALSGSEISIRNEAGEAIPDGNVGEICVSGPTVFAGYLDDDAETASVFFGPWLRTGDLGRRDASGRLWLSGRIKELINLGGSKVSPIEIEEVLNACPGVKESAVIGVSDERFSAEKIHAFVVMEQVGCTTDIIGEFAAAHLDPMRRPSCIHFVPNLPKTDSGKLQRRRLHAQVQPPF